MCVTGLTQSLRNKGKKKKSDGTVFSERTSGINLGSVHVGFMEDKVEMGKILPRKL
jgi:hypothetical protein